MVERGYATQALGRRVATTGWRNVSVHEDLARRIDRFLEENEWGFSSRGEVVATAVREFLMRHTPSKDAQEKAVEAPPKRK